MELATPNPKPIRLFYFWAGIIATFAYRIIIVLNFYNPLWVKISWYIGTVGFIIYFWHRFVIARKRSELVSDYKLVEAVENMSFDNDQQKQAMRYLIKTTQSSKAKWNYMFIFALSALALVTGIVMDAWGFGS